MDLSFGGSYNVHEAEQPHVSYVDTIACCIQLLDESAVTFKVNIHSKGQLLLELTFDYLELLERDFFGLIFASNRGQTGNAIKWLDPLKKVRQQCRDGPPYTFAFRVRFYVPDPICLHEEYTRYHFYLQIRKDISDGKLPVSKNVAAQLAGLALQSELGDFCPEECRPGYVSQFRFIPQQSADFELQASEWHRKLCSMVPSAAELEYLNIACQQERYGVKAQEAIDQTENHVPVTIGISHVGVTLFRSMKPSTQFTWDNILRIQFRAKKFIVQLKTLKATILPINETVPGMTPAPSSSNLVGTINVSRLIHTFCFATSDLAKSFWQHAVAYHAFFRVHEPSSYGRNGWNHGHWNEPVANASVSVTAVHSAISRITSGLRRYFSFALRRGTSATDVSGSIGGVERTLSTVMELRRNSRVFDRGFSRTSSRRSVRRSMLNTSSSGYLSNSVTASVGQRIPQDSSQMTVTANIHPQQSSNVRNKGGFSSSSRFSNHTSKTNSGSITAINQIDAVSQPNLVRSNLTQSERPRRTGVASKTNTDTHIGSNHSLSLSKKASDVGHALGSQDSINLLYASQSDKSNRQRSNRGNVSPTHASHRQNKQTPSPSPNSALKNEKASPKLHNSLQDSKHKIKRSHLSHIINGQPEVGDSDNSVEEPDEMDPVEAASYWNIRRSQSTNRPNRPLSKVRTGDGNKEDNANLRTTTQSESAKRIRSAADAQATSIERLYTDEITSKQHSTSKQVPVRPYFQRPQPPNFQKKTGNLSGTTRGEVGSPNGSRQSIAHSKVNLNSGSAFHTDPFHPGAPSGDNRMRSSRGDLTIDPQTSDLVRIRIRPDSHGHFGFNVRGGSEYNRPIIVTRVGPNMPADLCIPPLSEGDQIIFINGKEVSGCTQQEVLTLIRSSSGQTNSTLELLVKPGDYVTDDVIENDHLPDSGDAPPIPPRSYATNLIKSSNACDASNSRMINSATDNSASSQSKIIQDGELTDPLLKSMAELEAGLDGETILNQFERLPRKKQGYTMKASGLEENVSKNRFRDISPYDQTRVILGHGSGDYINANFVNMDFPKANVSLRYIAAQGPMPSTYGDFWQMCWEQNVTVIVMLTAISERGRVKCHQYWPDMGKSVVFSAASTTSSSSSITYLQLKTPVDLQLQTTQENVSSDFATREFTITQISNNARKSSRASQTKHRRKSQDTRKITQLQYISWPDHGVPANSNDLIEFVGKVRKARAGNPSPIIVHCSAGIGRTGVLITMETALNLMERGQAVKPLELVQQMRSQRAKLIQTTKQFQFVCQTILEVFQRDFIAK